MAVTRVSIIGSTGSIGRSALEVIRHYPERFRVVGLAANSNIELLAEQMALFRPQCVAVADEAGGRRLSELNRGLSVLLGPAGVEEMAAHPVDLVLCAIVGAAGLRPVLRAIEAGNRIALANKEPLVMAGQLIMQRAKDRGVTVLPVDSEHNAIFQCLQGHKLSDVHCIHLTASGGPFYGRSRENLRDVTPDEAARHPRWDMGTKVSVDSATLMNKGLEVIEAMWLFGLPADKIRVIIHPQSIVHSMVEFSDGSILAHLGPTDMKFPILFALSWPERLESPMSRLDLTKVRNLSFAAPDFTEFPCLEYAVEAAKIGGTAPAILNAANETAVEAFCQRRIPFLKICEVVRAVLDRSSIRMETDLDTVLAADTESRRTAAEVIHRWDSIKYAFV
ncbi:MAG: 1-deoxy-D-xylulose-5-phosphate reductoisomerase [Candidatus Hydrogenedentes bacterium]|nr:1-deoxy-D-xylulose-5-phosphate reductoisomerase [Candidatus Hydrogenedentota bacterium]